MRSLSKVLLVFLGRRPGYRGILLVILGRRLVYHRVDSGADNGNSHCFMALMSGAKVFVNDERLLRSSPWERHCIERGRAFLCPTIVRTGISRHASFLVGQADEPYGYSVSSGLVLTVDPHI